ncbi:rhamnogalacturonan acetylesterase [Subsaxibacter sp. CAU 1640]|uniref:rhamnogalacturonan acetylesterase n=1 Tax=Subsaxibacter sp. CAU 1640 TaxID=2933271 RepID=UPI002004EC8A|nr:rhamnogalacturonan acetylesterase [Subsaxibacter sp. CAU 1640]MCK7589067.1 rhamnogalacturonan acetylesterase [Subsaxibacter sp. CAU 1640]
MKVFKLLLLLVFLVACKDTSKNEDDSGRVTSINIHTIGDSTMANKPNPEENPERGWAQLLPEFLTNSATVFNHAVNGRSTRSFINEKRWDSVMKQLKKGDFVFIQFGHNDQKVNDPKRYTNPHTSYRNNLIKFVEESRSKGAMPVLFTSIVRRNFNADGTLVDTHGVYPMEVRLVAQDLDVPLIDLQYLTEQLEESYGAEGSKTLHLHYLPNAIPYYPEGKTDDTHLSVLGATEVAKLAVEELRKKVPSLGDYFK